MDCVLCGKTVSDTNAAIDAGWIPSYWDGDGEVEGPFCDECVAKRLQLCEETGDHELSPNRLEPMTIEEYGHANPS